MDPALVRISRFLSLVLRHDPGRIGLALDAAGWADVAELLAAAQRAGVDLDRAMLDRVVAENDKQRFALDAGGERIRASQGHSLRVDLGLSPLVPPERLFHGTTLRFLDGIRRQGLLAGKRQHVHLSADEPTARAVGRRHGAPVVLAIDAGRMQRDGFCFFRSDNGVWLIGAVPPEYIDFPE